MEQFTQTERNLLEQADKVTTLGKCFAWMQRCDELIEQLEERSHAKRLRLSIGHRQSVVAQLVGAKLAYRNVSYISVVIISSEH